MKLTESFDYSYLNSEERLSLVTDLLNQAFALGKKKPVSLKRQKEIDSKIILAQNVLDSIPPNDIPITQEQMNELDRRIAAYQAGEEYYSTWEKVKSRLMSNL